MVWSAPAAAGANGMRAARPRADEERRSMADDKLPGPPPQFRLPDPGLVTRTMSEVAERGQRIVTDFLKRQSAQGGGGANALDPLNIGGAFLEMTGRLMANPTQLVQIGRASCRERV